MPATEAQKEGWMLSGEALEKFRQVYKHLLDKDYVTLPELRELFGLSVGVNVDNKLITLEQNTYYNGRKMLFYYDTIEMDYSPNSRKGALRNKKRVVTIIRPLSPEQFQEV